MAVSNMYVACISIFKTNIMFSEKEKQMKKRERKKDNA